MTEVVNKSMVETFDEKSRFAIEDFSRTPLEEIFTGKHQDKFYNIVEIEKLAGLDRAGVKAPDFKEYLDKVFKAAGQFIREAVKTNLDGLSVEEVAAKIEDLEKAQKIISIIENTEW